MAIARSPQPQRPDHTQRLFTTVTKRKFRNTRALGLQHKCKHAASSFQIVIIGEINSVRLLDVQKLVSELCIPACWIPSGMIRNAEVWSELLSSRNTTNTPTCDSWGYWGRIYIARHALWFPVRTLSAAEANAFLWPGAAELYNNTQ